MTQPHGLGRKPHPDTARAAELYPITAHPLYREVYAQAHFYWEGEAWLDQGNTGTCVGNANAHLYADAPLVHTGIDETWARELYVAASGDETLDQGTSEILAARVLKSRGQISAYHWVTSPDELRNALMSIGPVVVGVDWHASMDHPKLGYNDRAYLEVDFSSPVRGGHEFLLNAISLDPTQGPSYYRMKNSWGRGWPADAIDTTNTVYGPGTARIACDQMEELIFGHGGDACLITEVA